ncbi:MAG TPA: 50S ribosomal protein L33 [Candidatus Cloacimonetes bacterium]|nr:50S ribosomal protein L33 [Candidatus Cloacimonadota bacterium]
MREIITLACEECKNRNYTMTKNRRKHPERVAFKKFCPNCRKHTIHKQNR